MFLLPLISDFTDEPAKEIKTNEQLRFEDPGELGRLLGLDRIPEVKTFRLKIKAMCTEEASRAWMLQLATSTSG